MPRLSGGRLAGVLVASALSASMIRGGAEPAANGTVDLAASGSALPVAAVPGDSITFAVVISNNGPDPATNLLVSHSVTGATITGGATATGTPCAVNADGSADCALATLAAGASAIVNLTARVNAVGAVQDTAVVVADQTDPSPANNTITIAASGSAGIHVGVNGCTLVDAVNAANSNAVVNGCEAGSATQPDVIVVPAGVYSFDVPASAGSIDTSDGNALPVVNSDIVLRGGGAGLTVLERSAQAATNFRFFQVLSGTLTLEGVTLRNGAGNRGGAVNLNYFGGGHVVAVDASFAGNRATEYGGAIANGDLTALRSTFTGNAAPSGAVARSSFADLRDSTVTGNAASAGSTLELTSLEVSGSEFSGNTGDGSVLNVSGCYQCTWPHFTLDRSRILNNRGTHAAPVVSGVAVRVSGSTFAGNVDGSDAHGGALVAHAGGVIDQTTFRGNEGGVDGGGLITEAATLVTTSTFDSNHALYGGAIRSGGGALTLRNVTIAGNRADRQGGGVWVSGGGPASTVFLNNVTIAGNAASGYAGGVGIEYNGDIVYLKNSIIAGNTTNGAEDDCYDGAGPWASQGHNVVGYLWSCFTPGTGDVTSTSPSTPIDPRLGPLQDNGGPTLTRALLTASPALDAGSPATPGTDPGACETADQRGIDRPQGAACDIGAVEMRGVVNLAPVVTSPGDVNSQEASAQSVAIAATDPNGDPLTYSASGLPPGIRINAATGVLSGTIPFGSHGTYVVTVSASDGQLSTDTAFIWTVDDAAPSLVNPGDQTSFVGASVLLRLFASDSDGDPLTFSATGLPESVLLDPHTGIIEGGAPASTTPYAVTITVADGFGLSATVSFTWSMRPQPSATEPWSIQTVATAADSCGSGTTVDALMFDPAGRPFVGWSAGPCVKWARADAGTWTAHTIVPPAGAATPTIYGAPAFAMGSSGTPFVAYAAQGSTIIGDQQTWVGTVLANLDQNPQGTAPTIDFVGNSASCTVGTARYSAAMGPLAASPTYSYATACQGGGGVVLDGHVVDAGGESFSAVADGPDGRRHLLYARLGYFGATPGIFYYDGATSHQLPVPSFAYRGIAIAIDRRNRIHVAVGGVSNCSNTGEGGLVHLVSDDGVAWSLEWIDADSGRAPSIAFDPNGEPAIAYSRYGQSLWIAHRSHGAWVSEVVRDFNAASAADSTSIAFDPQGRAVIAFVDPQSNEVRTATATLGGDTVALVRPVDRVDPLGSWVALQEEVFATLMPLTFAGRCLPAGVQADPGGSMIGIPSQAGSWGPILSVTDPLGRVSTTSFTWTISDDHAPTIASPGDQTTHEQTDVVALALTASDPDNDPLTFTASGLPNGLRIDAATGVITGSVDLGASASSPYIATVTVADGRGGTASATFSWTVLPPGPAVIDIVEHITVTDAITVLPSAMLNISEAVHVVDDVGVLPSAMLNIAENVTVHDDTDVANTAAGQNISIAPPTATGSSPATLTFASVLQPGLTTLTVSSAGPPAPAGFDPGVPTQVLDLSTTAIYAGPISVCVNYTGTAYRKPANAQLFHYEDGAWVNRTTGVDLGTSTVCGSVTSLSPFAVFEPSNRPPVARAQSVRRLTGAVCQAAVAPADVDAGTFDPDGDPFTLALAPVGPFGLGTTNVTLTATDIYGASGQGQAAVTVVDATPPAVAASLTPAGHVEPEQGRYLVAFGATDACDASPAMAAVIQAPAAAGFRVVFDRDREDEDGSTRIMFDLKRRHLVLEGDDRAALTALLDSIERSGGAPVINGQLLDVHREPSDHVTLVFRGNTLVGVRGPLPTLKVTATDASGNVGSASATPTFAIRGGGK